MKKFITIALAVAVLFSFAACQQAYKVPTGLSVSTTRTGYLVGEQIDLSTVTGTLEYSDGSTRTISGAELSAPQGLDVDSTTTEISFVYGGNGGVGATLLINVYNYSDIEKISVTELPSTTSEVNKGTMFRIPASATLPDGSVASVEVFIGADTSGKKVGDVVKATPASVGIGDFSKPTWITGVELEGFDNWEITIVSTTEFDASTVASLSIEQVNSTRSDGKNLVGDTVTYKVYAVDGNGNKEELTSADYTWLNGKAPASSYVLTGTANASSETYTAIYNENPKITNATGFKYETVAADDWITSFAITPKANTSINGGTTLQPTSIATYYDVTATYAAKGAQTYTLSADNAVIMNPAVPVYGTEAGQATSYTLQIRVKYADDWTTVVVNSMPIANNG